MAGASARRSPNARTRPAPRPTPSTEAEPRAHFAAVDLGSNSFHYVIAALDQGELVPIDRQREQVQLARGLRGRTGRIANKAQDRALACLARFRQRLEHIPGDRVRAVGTNTLRRARNARDFVARAEETLGHSIEIVSGQEEARLIYLGVSHSLPDHGGPRLVLDIGGGSTELVIGQGFEPIQMHSLAVGCIDYARRFFRRGAISRDAFDEAVLAVEGETQGVRNRLLDRGWDTAVGSSGTIKATAEVLQALGLGPDGITRDGLLRLRKLILGAKNARELALPALSRDRRPIFPAGVAILLGLFELLPLGPLRVAGGALREGVLYDLLGRIRHEDVRQRTIRTFMERYRVEDAQAARVERTALALLLHAPAAWGLDPIHDGRVLAWAASLHEVGLSVALDGSHRHSAYLVDHADMPGFAREEQHLLAWLVGNHRGRVAIEQVEDLPRPRRQAALRLLVLLRLAVLLHRARSPARMPPIRLKEEGEAIAVLFPDGWLERHPLTRQDLERERERLKRAGVRLRLGS
jgi:exopolyphosphatase/guanosine-5'-triphosphate,3'-diphosphate pyrophosphatase